MQKSLIFILLFFMVLPCGFAFPDADPDLVVKIHINDKVNAREKILPLMLTIEDAAENWIQALVKRNQLEQLRQMGFTVEVIWADSRDRAAKMKVDMGRAWTSYQTMVTTLQSIAAAKPNICRLHNLGKSMGNRIIYAMEITDNPDVDETDEAEVRIIGNIHGDEYISFELMILLIKHLTDNYNVDSNITALVNSREIWIQPTANPDGHENGTRYNNNGVDLNRNHGYMYYSSGSGPFSEIEVQHLRQYSLKRNFSMSLSFHGVTTYFNYCWNFTGENAFDKQLMIALGQDYTAWNNYTVTEGYDWYYTNGDTDDWSYGCRGNMDITIETPGSSSTGVTTDWNANREAILYIIKQAGYGLSGTVTAIDTGKPIEALVTIEQHPIMVYTDPIAGDYHRPLQTGSYSVSVWANGYEKKQIPNVYVQGGQTTNLNVSLTPNNKFYAMHVGWNKITSSYVNKSSWYKNWPHLALGAPDGVAGSLGKGCILCLDMGEGFEIKNIAGPDFKVHEANVGDGDEDFTIYGSSAGFLGPWVLIGSGKGTTSFDLAATSLTSVRYLKVEDKSTASALVNYPGFDLDAIESLTEQIIPPDDDDLVISFENQGIWQLQGNTGNWNKLSNLTAKKSCLGDINGNTIDDLAVWLANPNEIWFRYDNGNWVRQNVSVQNLIQFTLGDINGDNKLDFIGIYSNGLWVRDSQTQIWQQFSKQIGSHLASGDITGNNYDDILFIQGNTAWIRFSHTGQWQKQAINISDLKQITMIDLNQDNRADILGSWNYGVWWKNTVSQTWQKYSANFALMVGAANLDEDTAKDLIGIWPDKTTWIRYAKNGVWQKISAIPAVWVSSGRMR